MRKLIDILTFKDHSAVGSGRADNRRDEMLREEERDAAVLADKYPAEIADIETASEYRLASLLQYPHY